MCSQIISDDTLVVVKIEKVTKPSMCRICLVENVRMHVVDDKSLQELYEKLTDIPFVTEDNRPMLACFICYAKLKQCYQLHKQCLQAEELFAQMVNEDYELYSAIYQGQLQWCREFITTPIKIISIVDESRVEKDVIKLEVPDVSETEPAIEIISVEVEECLIDGSDKHHDPYQELDDCPPQHPKSNSKDDAPLMVMEFVEEEEPAKQTTSTSVAKKPELGIRKSKQEDITPAQHSKTAVDKRKSLRVSGEKTVRQSPTAKKLGTSVAKKPKLGIRKAKQEDITPAQHSKTAVDKRKSFRLSGEKTVRQSPTAKKLGTSVAKKPELRIRKAKQKDITPAQHENNGLSDAESILTTENHTPKSLKIIESINMNPTVNKCIVEVSTETLNEQNIKQVTNHSTTAVDTNCRNNCNENDLMCNDDDTNRRQSLGIKEKPYKCDICQKSFAKKDYLSAHVRIHAAERPYKCDICQKSFAKKDYLSAHVRIHAAERLYKCDICQKSFAKKDYLSAHVRIHAAERPYKCDICQKSFAKKDYLSAHVRIHAAERPYKCDICQKSYTHKYNLKLHIHMHTGEKPYKCDMCLKSFINHPSLERHIRTHTGEKPYECVICQKRFAEKTNLNAHVLIHTGEKPYKCDICQKRFTNNRSLERHVGLHSDERSYECNVCQKRFAKQCYLNDHFRIHTVEKHYKCDICQKTFAKKTHLNAHVRIHTGEKPYKCAVCQRGFVMKAHLNEHVRIHTGEKPYECAICQKTFAKKTNLNAHHVRIHTDEKPYKCDICQKSLITKQSLESHVRIHYDERSYECGTCHKIFSNKSNLNAHVRTHTGKKPYVCEFCSKSFFMKANLNEHVRIHTGEKPYTCEICLKAFAKKANYNRHVLKHGGK